MFLKPLLFVCAFFYLFLPSLVSAQELSSAPERLEGVVERVLEEQEIDVMEKKQLYQKLELLVTEGSLKGQKIEVENGNLPLANVIRFKTGDEVVLSLSLDLEGKKIIQITDYVRRTSLYILVAIFVVLTFVVAKVKGVASLLGMGFSFLVIFTIILPQIMAGRDPIFISILGSAIIIPVSFYLSHGLNRKTTVAILGTILALIITGILANIFVEAAHLSGFVTEEAGFLQVMTGGLVNIKGLLLAGIIIGALGVLDDVTVSQSAVVEQLSRAGEKFKEGELYSRAMNVGKDHISSMVNTLVLVYTGASLPLLLLFMNNPRPFGEVLNYEVIANEIIRTLTGSIGLILAVPITTFLAVLLVRKEKSN